jgi:hypothetical protein
VDSDEGILEVIEELQDLIRRGRDYICVLASYLYNTRRRAELQDGQ